MPIRTHGKYVPNYTINLLCPAEIAEEDLSSFRSSLSPETTKLSIGLREPLCSKGWIGTRNRINTLADGGLELKKEGDSVNMWVALENKVKQAREEGYKEGYEGDMRRVWLLPLQRKGPRKKPE
ncbi:MAG: hypothetical protein IJU76_12045 [Desulfovibrionaceae bacterium]|nr:hypothetical protein [Desulfovibrionaceae bacterium]